MVASTPHILVAEDNLAMADVVRFNLRNAGFTVTVCRNGQDALGTLQQRSIDLLITDYQMPGLTGEEICRAMRQDVRLRHVPAILLSAKGLELDVDMLRNELGLQAVLFKPFSPRELTQLVRTTLETALKPVLQTPA
ncbi:MAG: response regulator [Planctomycetaceae bacterium]|nr:response regulator [Planctomycetaceae bacterium]